MQESLGSSAGPAVAADSHPAITKLEMLRRHTMDSLKVIIFSCGCKIFLLIFVTKIFYPEMMIINDARYYYIICIVQGQLVEDDSVGGSVLLPAKYDIANIHF